MVAKLIYDLYLEVKLDGDTSWRQLAVHIVATLTQDDDYADYWQPVLRAAKAYLTSNRKRSLNKLQRSLDSAFSQSRIARATADSLDDSAPEYKGREAQFMQKIKQPSLFVKEVNPLDNFTEEVEPLTIKEDNTDYGGREDVFRQRIKQPGAFRRSYSAAIQIPPSKSS